MGHHGNISGFMDRNQMVSQLICAHMATMLMGHIGNNGWQRSLDLHHQDITTIKMRLSFANMTPESRDRDYITTQDSVNAMCVCMRSVLPSPSYPVCVDTRDGGGKPVDTRFGCRAYAISKFRIGIICPTQEGGAYI